MKNCDRTKKICKKHGRLNKEDISLSIIKDKDPIRVSVLCSRCLKENKNKSYNRLNIYLHEEIIKCGCCKKEKHIIEFGTNELQSKWPVCRICNNTRQTRNYRRLHLKKTYNITEQEYNNLLKTQNYKCKICNKEESMLHQSTDKIKRLSVDHNHKTGKVRGLLCANCNLMIGHATESSFILRSGADYMDSHA